MKKDILKRSFAFLLGLSFCVSCVDDLLNQQPTTQLAKDAFWKTPGDAQTALYGAYAEVRGCFNMEFWYDGLSEITHVRMYMNRDNTPYGTDGSQAYRSPSSVGDIMEPMFKALYAGVNRCNYVIDNVEAMLETAQPSTIPQLETVLGDARLLRGLCYLKLISWWGDVQLIEHDVTSNDDVITLSRTPIAQIKDFIIADFTYAYEKLPVKSSVLGRASKPAALALRGKMHLYWASWNKNGWPELEGFAPSASEATAAYEAAAEDFRHVIDDFGLNLYKNGEPGETSPLGQADPLPNYYELFTPEANGNEEFLMVFPHGGRGTGQGEFYLRCFGGNRHESAQAFITPRLELVNRYQSIVTGDFCEPLIPCNPTQSTDGVNNREVLNSAVNPQSYIDRDYRMKASVMWDYEISRGMLDLRDIGWVPFVYRSWNVPTVIFDGSTAISWGIDQHRTGYAFRKFVRRTAGAARNEGNFNVPVIRLADVFLMYAEADNELRGPQAKAIELINRIRYRGHLPPLAADKVSSKETFFSAIEQERIIELVGEGQRMYDLRRWRKLEEVWGGLRGPGVRLYDTWGAQQAIHFQNVSELTFQRCYINRIPSSERDKNPNLTQNRPWL
ncbi:MAG: RagB/SusD family nutrient uptake outer membrane protein [Tannerella sp.]|jgi:hypothetical protein|nr:RagB/SusD family nutrient uptake outer membrane protein [Tannerella sp.]